MVVESEASAAGESGVFRGPLIALTTPWCESSCDILTALYKASGRGTLIGSKNSGSVIGSFVGHLAAPTGERSDC